MKQKIYPGSSAPSEMARNWFNEFVKGKISSINHSFNHLTASTKRLLLILFGISIAFLCTFLILRPVQDGHSDLHIDKIMLPDDINRNPNNTHELTPVGNMKGEIDGQFESFYIAVDAQGQLFINRNPEYSENRYRKSNGWEPVTSRQLEAFEKELQFTPHQTNGLKK